MMKYFLVLFLFVSIPALAMNPDDALKNPKLEQRAREISHNIRCLVCQGEAIDESNADLAKDLRRLIRERLTKGDTDQQVFAYLQERYGDYVLMKPPLNQKTAILWGLPFMVFIAGLIVALLFIRQQKKLKD